MTQSREDKLFDRFRRTDDVRALAAVFDRVAPVLWRIAVRLSSDAHAAEDAVQDSFLAAIEDAAAWESERPLLPWMLGILTNQIRNSRRSANRQVDQARLSEPTRSDPSAAAEDSELREAVSLAIERVPAAYRSTLEQHLLHGSAPSEIATVTGARPSTVRMQLRRGLTCLRQSLPKGLVGTGLAGALSPAVHASIRHHVLSQVKGGSVAAGASMTGFVLAGMAANKIALAIIAALVLISAIIWNEFESDAGFVSSANELARATQLDIGSTPLADVVTGANSIRRQLDTERPNENESVASTVTQSTAEKSAPRLALESEPAIGLKLAIRLLDPTGQPLEGWAIRAWRGEWSRDYFTDTNGQCDFEPTDPKLHEIRVAAPMGFGVVQTLEVTPSSTVHIVRVPTDQIPSARVKGRLVGKGVDLSQVHVQLRKPSSGAWYMSPTFAPDPETGRFISDLLTPGKYSVAISSGRGPVGGAFVPWVRAGSTVDVGDINLSAPASILVMAKDQHGERIKDVRVRLRPTGGDKIGGKPFTSTATGILITGIPIGFSFDLLITSKTTIPQWRHRVQPRSGEEVRIELVCRPGTSCVFTCEGLAKNEPLQITLRDDSQTVVIHERMRVKKPSITVGLAPGTYELVLVVGAVESKRSIEVPKSSTPFAITFSPPSRD